MGLPRKIKWFVYLSHTLSTWGDRMWSFGVGLFMVIISPESLRVTAVYGLSMGCSILLFGALIGDWIDKTPRLRAARTALIIQNTSVIVCAGSVFTVVTFKAEIQSMWEDEGLLTLCYVGIILIAILCTLGSMATNIAVQRDWIVEICGRDKDLLATMTATLRRIDLFNSLVAPVVTGQIMYFASVGTGALFIAGWNLVSVFVEYILLWKVYSLVPALKSKKLKYKQNQEKDETAQEMMTINNKSDKPTDAETEENLEDSSNKDKFVNVEIDSPNEGENVQEQNNEATDMKEPKVKKQDSVLMKMFSGFIILYRGWKTYMKYNVAFAGLGLACLYMTVLGFDNITVGFAYTQGINESYMGLIMAAGAVMGIFGTILYPIIRRHIGLERTGLFGFFIELSFLCLCVASVWAPGSPFDPLHNHSDQSQSSLIINNKSESAIIYNVSTLNETIVFLSNDSFLGNVTKFNAMNDSSSDPETSYVSVVLLMTGIIGARCGLWMADLTITQLFLENVKETERGIVNGVQTSLNKLMDMLKFIMVIVAPEPEVFGILILISFTFIVIGWISYAKYSHNARGHLFHFDRLPCTGSRDDDTSTAGTESETGREPASTTTVPGSSPHD